MSLKPVASLPRESFSLVLGGPLYQMYLRSRLLRPPTDLLERRIAAAIVITWLPLLILTIAAGTALGGAKVPFLLDLEANIRFLVAVPLLLGAEILVHHRIWLTVSQFVDRGIVVPEDRARFDTIMADCVRVRNSAAIEIMIMVIAGTLGYWLWSRDVSLHGGTWYSAIDTTGSDHLTAAGWWYAFVSLNVFRFLLFRWFFRLMIWYLFLWRVSRLRLRLNPLHPDRSGGLGFLGNSIAGFAPLLLAQTVTISAAIAGHILHEGAKLPAFHQEMAFAVVFLLALVLLPLAFFGVALGRARRAGRLEYGLLAMQYVDGFQQKWMRGQQPKEEPLVGSGDIQSLADLANAYSVVQEMGVMPLSMRAIGRLAVVISLPFVPLVLTIFPLNELIGRLLGKLL